MGEIRFGIFDHIERTSSGGPLNQLLQERLALIEAADRSGFWGYHVAEHHFTPLSMAPSQNLLLAAAAARTSKIRLGPMVYLLPLYHPIRLIEEICTLDHLSGGRLEIGVGRGISPYELAYFGVPILESRARFQEALAVILKGLRNSHLDHHGRFYTMENVPMELRPMQNPNPGFWYGANNEEGARFAAEHGMNVVFLGQTENVGRLTSFYREARARGVDEAQNANPQAAPTAGIIRHFFVAETDREAQSIGETAWRAYYNNTEKLWSDNHVKWLAHTDDLEVAVKRGIAIAGSVASVRDQLAHHIEVTKPDYVILSFAWGSMTAEQSRRSFDLFASKVMPELVRR